MSGPTFTFYFEGRKPSAAQCLKRARDLARKADAEGLSCFGMQWGEQGLDFFRHGGRWSGFGWIGRVSGQDMARDLTPAP